jgi:hypothetical protein
LQHQETCTAQLNVATDCKVCGQDFENVFHLREHRRAAHPETVHTCGVCSKVNF